MRKDPRRPAAHGSVRSILDNHLDRAATTNGPASHEPIHHENIRGPRYYH